MSRRPRPTASPTLSTIARAALLAALWPLAPGAHAQDATADADPPSARTRTLPARTRLGFERLHLPGSEGLGLTGLSELLGVGGDLWLGGGVYGATTGHRGGLFVPGVEIAWTPSLSRNWQLDTGLFAGGGGGGNAPVGGGLMLRPHVDLLWRRDGFSTGPSVSWVKFGNGGAIDSAQVGWVVDIDSSFRFRDPSASRSGTGLSAPWSDMVARGLGFEQVDATLTRYRPGIHSRRVDNNQPLGTITLVGLRAEHPFGNASWFGLQSAGAASGGVAGYAEVLGAAGTRWGLVGKDLSVGLTVAAGLGGGGGVDTGGGLLIRMSGGLDWHVTDTLGLSAEAGVARSPQGRFDARTTSVALTWTLDPHPGAERDGTRMEWVAGTERYDAARVAGGSRPLAAGVLAINRFITPNVYLTGQAHSAFAGGAGAYSVGLFGVGTQWPVMPRLRLGAEALLGAAGGGGVDTRGGTLAQLRGYADVPLNRAVSFRVGLGDVRAVHGGVSAPVVDAALVYQFGVDRPR